MPSSSAQFCCSCLALLPRRSTSKMMRQRQQHWAGWGGVRGGHHPYLCRAARVDVYTLKFVVDRR